MQDSSPDPFFRPGLEFLIAADIIHTVLTPTLADLAILGAIVGLKSETPAATGGAITPPHAHKYGEHPIESRASVSYN